MKRWTKARIGVAAVLLAIAAATGAYAMRDDGGSSTGGQSQNEDAAQDDGGTGVFAICLEGTEDCQDTVVMPDAEGCPPDGCDGSETGLTCEEAADCDKRAADCAADVGCDMLAPEIVEKCVTEGDPPVETCYSAGCDYPGTTPLVDPVPEHIIEPAPEYIGPPETIIDPATDTSLATPYCEPVIPCEEGGCPPIDCGVILPAPLTDPAPQNPPLAAPDCEPVTPCEGDECLAPDCAVSSDGNATCPTPCPDNARCISPECSVEADGSVSCPGSPGAQTLPVDCTDDGSLVHCVEPAHGAGSGSSEGSAGATP